MGLNDTPLSERVSIGFFGCVNAGKSSIMNAVTGQNISVVSSEKGTTTDPVRKTMEILPLGPVVFIDTPGLDDTGILGEARTAKTEQILNSIDIAVVVIDAVTGKTSFDSEIAGKLKKANIPCIEIYNKADLISERDSRRIYVSALTGEGIDNLKRIISSFNVPEKNALISFGINKNNLAVLVTPIDESAPKGRIILPQQMVIRELLDKKCITVVVQPDQLPMLFKSTDFKPDLVITDSQVFEYVKNTVPLSIRLTSFSILFANKKGFLRDAVSGVAAVNRLNDNDVVLISEACTHHRQCNDIGSVKIPQWLIKYTGKKLEFEYSSGESFPADLSRYAMVVHCGACMINDNILKTRADSAMSQGVPFTNFGILIAYLNGILERSLEIFPEVRKIIAK